MVNSILWIKESFAGFWLYLKWFVRLCLSELLSVLAWDWTLTKQVINDLHTGSDNEALQHSML